MWQNNTRTLTDFGNMYGWGFIALMGIFIAVFLIAVYVYFALAWQTIARKLKYKKAWLAWIPFANLAMILKLGEFDWKWIFLILIPILGWIPLAVMLIIAHWRIFEKRKYPGFFALALIIPQLGGILYLISIGFAAWSDRKSRLQL